MKEEVRERYGSLASSMAVEPGAEPPTLGLGDVVELAAPRPGETVLDLGSGPGRDLLAAARAVGDTGRAIGVDMTPEMIAKGREAAAAFDNVSILEGDLERLPLPCASVDVVISNCVINLVDDKTRALTEAFRVLAPGGRLAVLDTAFDSEPGAEFRADPDAWGCCTAGALVKDDYADVLQQIGFTDVSVEVYGAGCGELNGVATRAVAVKATKPGPQPEAALLRTAVPRDRARIDQILDAAGLPSDLRTEDAIVAVENGTVIGVAALERHGTTALLRSVAVDAVRRGQALGTRLVFAALEVARWAGASDVYLLTTGSKKFFDRVGFVPVSKKAAAAASGAGQFGAQECSDALAMKLSFEQADLPLLGRPSKKELPTFQSGSCC